jgi:alkylhydroperoxidase family enzyme
MAGLVPTLALVPRSARWVMPTFASAFRGTDASTLEPRLRTLAIMRVCAVDRAPYWRTQFERSAPALGISDDEMRIIGSEEWETAPAFSDRERAAITWADRVAKRLARSDGAAYRLVQTHCTIEEIVELTAIASLAAMATRITNALRIAPEPAIGLTAAGGAMDAQAWQRQMFDEGLPSSWAETVGGQAQEPG